MRKILSLRAYRLRKLCFESLDLRNLLASITSETPSQNELWQVVDSSTIEKSDWFLAERYSLRSLDTASLQKQLALAPLESDPRADNRLALELPSPDGGMAMFSVYVSSIMEPELAAQFPEIQTYAGQGITDPAATIRFDLTPSGFHAQVLTPNGAYLIDPYFRLGKSQLYTSYYKSDAVGTSRMEEVSDGDEISTESKLLFGPDTKTISKISPSDGTVLNRSGTQLRTYRAAVAATGEYTAFHGGTVALGQSAIVTAMNRVTGIYENELSIRMVLVANNSNLVYTNSASDPYTNSDGLAMLTQNQTNVTNVIGAANYDIGHVFSTGGGGVASLRSVGSATSKAQGVTGSPSPVNDSFWVDYVAHEMGHQFGGSHTFNSSNGNCGGGNRSASTAYEIGSGSTIQAYAGICGTDNLQPNSDPYFHSISFDQMISFVDITIPGVGTRTATNNSVPTVNAGNDFSIPANTPFVLTATGSDANPSNVLTYNWEQRNLGASTTIGAADNGSSPLFRSFNPTTDPVRTIPRLSNLIANTLVTGEIMPSTTRTLNFRATVRDNSTGGGGVNTDDAVVNVVNTGSAFAVTSPNTNVSWPALSTQTITWNVAGTTGNGINTPNVDITLSLDGGLTYSTVLATAVPNDGSQDVTMPNVQSTVARVRIQGSANIFFDISNTNFTLTAPISGIDFGDAPDIYGTLLASNGARHDIGGPTLGIAIDVENDGQPAINALGDGADEDGVAFIDPLVVGTTVNIEVRSSVGGGILNYFFDFDGVGGFGNSPNEVFAATLTGGTQLIPVVIPSNAELSSYARFRISTAGGLGPNGLATSGEVEDYQVMLFATPPAFDFGDAPSSYGTLLSNDGARHVVLGPRLGALVDGDLDGQPNASSTGDGRDDDGVIFRASLVPGVNIPVSVTSTGGILDYFIDWDRNGVFGNLANEVFNSTLGAGTQVLQLTVPANASLGVTRARFRVTSAGGVGPNGLASDGEVEDYQLMIVDPSNYERFDSVTSPALPIGWTQTTTSSNPWGTLNTSSHSAPNHAFVNNISTVSDSRLTSPLIPITSSNLRFGFRNFYNSEPTYDGGVLEVSIGGGGFQDIVAAGGTFVVGGYNAIIDFGFASPIAGRQAWSGNSGGFIQTTFDLPQAAVGQVVQLRWRFATDSTVFATGWRIDSITTTSAALDFGDAPDPPYPTLSSNGGAAHAATNLLRLGTLNDSDGDGQPDAGAAGDGLDDDGVVLPTTILGPSTTSIVVNASGDGILNAWFDFNNNGNWTDPGEQPIKDLAIVAGVNNLNISVPNIPQSIVSFARFRFSSQAGLAADGTAPDGEVEDYQVSIQASDVVSPTVSALKLTSSSWLTGFKSYWDPSIPDPAASGGSLPDSRGMTIPTATLAQQLTPIPWVNMNQILVRFSEDVVGTGVSGVFLAPSPTEPGDIRINGVNVVNYGNRAGSSLVSSISFNSTTDTMVIIMSESFADDKLVITIPSGRIKDVAGNNLAPFSFRFNVLPGDVNADLVVANNDATIVRLHLDRSIADGINFDPRRDVNGDGVVANNDATLVRLRLDSTLPGGEPVAHRISGTPLSIGSVVSGEFARFAGTSQKFSSSMNILPQTLSESKRSRLLGIQGIAAESKKMPKHLSTLTLQPVIQSHDADHFFATGLDWFS